MFLHKVATLAAVAAAQYAEYNYFDTPAFTVNDFGKQQLSASAPHTNGFQCVSCIGLTQLDCTNSATTVHCEGEQFHCYTLEKKHFGQVSYN